MLGFLARTKNDWLSTYQKLKIWELFLKSIFPQNFNCKAKTVKVAKLTGAVIGK